MRPQSRYDIFSLILYIDFVVRQAINDLESHDKIMINFHTTLVNSFYELQIL